MISRPCRLLFLAVALAAGFFNSLSAQETVPKLSGQDSYNAGMNGYSIIGNYKSSAEARQAVVDRGYCHWQSQPAASFEDSTMRNSLQRFLICTDTYGNTTKAWYYAVFPTGTSDFCPDTHPIDNGDGTCSKSDEQKECEANVGTESLYGDPYESAFVCIDGCVSARGSVGIQLVNDPYPRFTYTSTAQTCSGSENGAVVDESGQPTDPETPPDPTADSCTTEAAQLCGVTGQFAVGVGLVNGACSYSCVDEVPDSDPFGDHDGDGIPNHADPDHPYNDGTVNEDWETTDPDGDHDGDGVSNESDPDHPLNQDDDGDGVPNVDDPDYNVGGGSSGGGGGLGWGSSGSGSSEGSLSGVEGLLERILVAEVADNALSTQSLEAIKQVGVLNQQGNVQASNTGKDIVNAINQLGEDLQGGGSGGVGDALWTNESATFEVETPDCTPDPVTGRCAEFGKIGVDSLPEKTLDISSYSDDFTPIDTASTCPAEMPLTLSFGAFNFNTSPLCDVLSGIYYLVMFSAYYLVARIITRGAAS